jgi:hypothetical protein
MTSSLPLRSPKNVELICVVLVVLHEDHHVVLDLVHLRCLLSLRAVLIIIA